MADRNRYNTFPLGRSGLCLSCKAEDRDYIGNYEFKNGQVHRVNTPYGYIAMGVFIPYERDYQGNNRNHANYYAYGLPVQGSEVKDPDPYLYSGKKFYSLRGINLYDFNARTYAPDIARFMQPDPLATENHGVSPYIYCNSDPINFIDPTGEKVYYVDGTGKIISAEEAGKHQSFNMTELEAQYNNYDGIVIIGQDGQVINQSEKFEKYTVGTTIENTALNKNGKPIAFTAMVIRGDEEGQKIFEFLADNITGKNGIEFGHIKAGEEGVLGYNIVSTSHSAGSEAGTGWLFKTQLKYGYTIREWNHSHPTTKGASGSDKTIRDYITKNNSLPNLIFKVYHVPSKTYIDYTHN